MYKRQNYVSPNAAIGDAHEDVTDYIRTKDFTPNTMLALRTLVSDIGNETALYKEMKNIPNDQVRNFRNDMYLISEAIRLMQKNHNPTFTASETAVLANYKKHIDHSTRFIPLWVKVAVAMALGLGTMVGWKRIVVTVGEKIGKSHLTYAQGAVAEITAMATDVYKRQRWGIRSVCGSSVPKYSSSPLQRPRRRQTNLLL